MSASQWQTTRPTTLGDALESIEAGASPQALARPAGPTEVGVLKVSAVTWGRFRPDENKALPSGFDASHLPTVRKGDLLLSRANTAELLALPVLVDADYNNLVLSDKTLRLVPRADIADTRFLLYALRQRSARAYFASNATGTSGSMRNVSQATLRRCPIPLPPLPEQKRIAAILDAADALRAKRRESIEQLDSLIQATFLEMFGDPVTNPKGWAVKPLNDMAVAIMSGTTPKGGEDVYVKEGIPFLRSQNVWKNRIQLDDIAYIDSVTHRRMKKSSLRNKDILMTKTGRINTEQSSLGRAALFVGPDDSANINGHVYLIRLGKGCVHEFVLRILTTRAYRDYIRGVCVGGIDKRQINKSHIERFPIISPPSDLQTRFASIVESIEQQKARLKAHLAELDTLFASLQSRAFNGELVA